MVRPLPDVELAEAPLARSTTTAVRISSRPSWFRSATCTAVDSVRTGDASASQPM